MEEHYVNSLIGQHSLFRGDVEVDGLVRIDGDYLGTVKRASRVLVGASGRADAVFHAKVVVIGGAFNGTIYASERIVVLAGAVALGSMYAPRILVEPGAILSCGLSIHGDYHDESSESAMISRGGQKKRTYQHHDAPVPTGKP